MSFINLLIISAALSMDAAAVCISNTMAYKNTSRAKLLAQPLFFGVFQAVMPVLGYYTGGLVTGLIDQYAGIALFLIFGFIGAKMIMDGLRGENNAKSGSENNAAQIAGLSIKVIIIQAIATSIDAFAVGVAFSVGETSLFTAVATIGITTAVCCFGALWLGRKFGMLLGRRAVILGGVILLAMGVKSLF